MTPLKKGDPCRVRIKGCGEVRDAIYYGPISSSIKKHHLVISGSMNLSVGRYGSANFIGPACAPVPIGESL